MSVDRVRVGQQWDIEFSFGTQRETATFFVTQDERPLSCGSGCEGIESIAIMGAYVREAATGNVMLWNYRDGQRRASFTARRLGRFDEAICQVALGTKEDTYGANIKTGGATTYADGSCRVLSAR